MAPGVSYKITIERAEIHTSMPHIVLSIPTNFAVLLPISFNTG